MRCIRCQAPESLDSIRVACRSEQVELEFD